jgi:hypothetical protein
VSRIVLRSLWLTAALAALSLPAQAQWLKVTGKAGYLSEWELAADVQENTSIGRKAYSGPMTLRHVGLCSMSGPEFKTGEIRLELSRWTSVLTATLTFDGKTCSYSGKLADDYAGIMDCPGTQGVPLTLRMR